MKKIFLIAMILGSLTANSHAQFNDAFKKATKKDSTGKTALDKASGSLPSGVSKNSLSNEDIIAGLKEALRVGTDSSTKKVGALDGFFGDAAIKILMPEEAKKVERSLRSAGMGDLVDNAILSMNRAAEDAANGVGDIFFNSIKKMSIGDGMQILQGGDFAATEYLKKTTSTELTEKFKPIIQASLTKTDATKYWKEVFSNYNKFTLNPVDPDLTAYVTEKALKGLFYNIGLQEQKIRKDSDAQVTSILQKVFGGK